MKKVWIVPIESLEERYSKQWNLWFPREFSKLGIKYSVIEGKTLSDKIEVGSFLDVYSTNFYKANQLCVLIKNLKEGLIKEDIIFFHDLWFPGLEMLQYIRQGGDKKFKIAGILHAGTYDPNDFLARKGMQWWGKDLENSWFNFVDVIFVATKYHKRLLALNRNIDPKKIYVTGLPIYFDDYPIINRQKENIIVFPHRLDLEKAPEDFDELINNYCSRYPDWSFIKTKEVCSNKEQYYQILAKSKISVSFALQETWGIAQQESIIYNCLPLVPDRLSYSEMYPFIFKYGDVSEFHIKLQEMMEGYKIYQQDFYILRENLKMKGVNAILNMVNILREL